MGKISAETSFIVLAMDGRHSTVSRFYPDAALVATLEAAMRQQQVQGYLCRLEGTYHSKTGTVKVVGLRALAGAPVPNSDPQAIDPRDPWRIAAGEFGNRRAGHYPKAVVLRDWQGEG